MGKGRMFGRAMRSKITATGRWVGKTNVQAACVGMKLQGGSPGKAVRASFTAATDACVKDPAVKARKEAYRAGLSEAKRKHLKPLR